MGKVSDKVGVVAPVIFGACCLGVGYILASMAPTLTLFVHGFYE